MDKRAEQAEQVKKKLEQELQKAKVYQGSTLSLDSMSDDSVETQNSSAGAGDDTPTGNLP